MKGAIIFCDDNYEKYSVLYEECNKKYDYSITIEVNDNDDLINLINNEEAIDNSIKEFLLYFGKDIKGKEKAFYENNSAKDLIKNIAYIEMYFDIDKVIQLIKKNPKLQDKKIVFCKDMELDLEVVNKIKNNLNTDNLYFLIDGNNKLIDFGEYSNTVTIIEKIVNEVRMLDLSPIETIMYVYDFVKERVYEDVADGEDLDNSRDLSKVLLGKKIVCTGYTKIFNAILKRLGFAVHESILDSLEDEAGHVRSEIYVIDPKYHLDGVYFFDSTWDSKQSEEDENYLYTYCFFAKTKLEMDEIDSKKKLIDIHFPDYNLDIIDEFEDSFKKNGFDKIKESMIRSINHMYLLIKKEMLLGPLITRKTSPFYNQFKIDNYIEELYEIGEKFNKPIYADTLLKILYNVRKKEYSINQDKYPFSKEDFYLTVLKSRWIFESLNVKLMTAITGKMYDLDDKSKKEYFENLARAEKLEEEIDKVKQLKR